MDDELRRCRATTVLCSSSQKARIYAADMVSMSSTYGIFFFVQHSAGLCRALCARCYRGIRSLRRSSPVTSQHRSSASSETPTTHITSKHAHTHTRKYNAARSSMQHSRQRISVLIGCVAAYCVYCMPSSKCAQGCCCCCCCRRLRRTITRSPQ